MPHLVSAARVAQRDGAVVWSADGLVTFDLPARAHAPVHLPGGRVLMMGRRPGLFASMIDPRDASLKASSFAPAKDCRFAGHAAVSPDGSTLVTSEFHAETFEAVLSARDPRTGAQRTCWRPGGIEPHEILFANEGARLIVALGGLIEDGGVAGPAFNPGGVRSAVLEVDPLSGRVLARHAFDGTRSSLSLRHLAVTPDGGTAVVAAQDQDVAASQPLLAVLRPGKALEFLSWPDPRDCDFRGYVGSVAVERGGAFAAAASPRGGVVGIWSVADGRWLGGVSIADACGLAAAAEPGKFWASSGLGRMVKIDAVSRRIEAQWTAEAGFDNHLLLV